VAAADILEEKEKGLDNELVVDNTAVF